MSKKGLEELAGSKNVTLRSPNYSIDRLVSILSSAIAHSTPTLSTEEQTMEVKKAVTKAALMKSFMSRLKGRARDYCSQGHRMEEPIARSFMYDVNEKK